MLSYALPAVMGVALILPDLAAGIDGVLLGCGQKISSIGFWGILEGIQQKVRLAEKWPYIHGEEIIKVNPEESWFPFFAVFRQNILCDGL